MPNATMRKLAPMLLSGLMGLLATFAASASREALQRAEEFIRIGDSEQALEILRELQVEQPDNDMVLYGIAMAYHHQAQRLLEQEELESGVNVLQEARRAYARLGETTNDAALRADASYNEATLHAEQSKVQFSPENYEEGVAGIRGAIAALEAVVAQYPDHAAAQHNLEHMRLVLRDILSDPPEEEEQESESQPEDAPQPFSIFNFAETDLPGAAAEVLEQGDTVMLHPSGGIGANTE